MIRNVATPYNASAGAASNHGPFNLTIGDGPKRKVSIAIVRETLTANESSVTFNGVNIFANQRQATQHSGATALNIAFYDYDVPDALPAGVYQWSFVTALSTTNVSAYAIEMTGRAAGAPESSSGAQTGPATGTNISTTLNVTEDADVFAIALHNSGAPTYGFTTGVVLGDLQNETNYTSASGEGSEVAAATPLTVTAVASASDSGYAKLLAVVSYAAQVGPVITQEPESGAVIAGAAAPELKSVTFSEDDTNSGVDVSRQWKSNVDGAGFTNLANADGWSGVTTQDASFTPPDAFYVGKTVKIKCTVTDSTGSQDTAEADLVVRAGATYDGDLVTDGAGDAAGTVESDVPCDEMASVFGIPGVFVELPLVAGAVTIRGGATSNAP